MINVAVLQSVSGARMDAQRGWVGRSARRYVQMWLWHTVEIVIAWLWFVLYNIWFSNSGRSDDSCIMCDLHLTVSLHLPSSPTPTPPDIRTAYNPPVFLIYRFLFFLSQKRCSYKLVWTSQQITLFVCPRCSLQTLSVSFKFNACYQHLCFIFY